MRTGNSLLDLQDTRRNRVFLWCLIVYAPAAAVIVAVIGFNERQPWIFFVQSGMIMLAWAYCVFMLRRMRGKTASQMTSAARPAAEYEERTRETSAARPLAEAEDRLVREMLRAAGRSDLTGKLDEAVVEDMMDGGMGSLLFQPPRGDRVFGAQIAECTFVDADGVHVSAALYVDDADRLFELDVFKGDSSPLIRLPGAADPVRIFRTRS